MAVVHRHHPQLAAVVQRAPPQSGGLSLGGLTLGVGGDTKSETKTTPVATTESEQTSMPTTTAQTTATTKNEQTTTSPTTASTTAQTASTTAATTATTSKSDKAATTATTPNTTDPATASTDVQETQSEQNQDTTLVTNPNMTVTQTASSLPSISSTAGASHFPNNASGVGKIIGVVGGVIGAIAAICILVGFIMRRLRTRRDQAAAINDYSPADYRKSTHMFEDSSSTHSSHQPSSLFERRMFANNSTTPGYGTGGMHLGGYGQPVGYYQQGSSYDNESRYSQQPYIHSPTPLDPFMASISGPSPAASAQLYSSRYDSPGNQSANDPMYSPGHSVMQPQQELAMNTNRMSTGSSKSVLINPHDFVASVDINRHRGSLLRTVSGSPASVAPAQGLETFLQKEPKRASTSRRDVDDPYGGI